MDATKIKNVQMSLGRCVLAGDFIAGFYDIFLESHPEVKPKFAKTDFEKQKELLRQGLNLAIMFASDDDVIGKAGIKKIRESHNKSHYDISPRLYPYWKKSIIEAVSKFDKNYSDDLKKDWDEVLQEAIDYIIDGYHY